MQAFAVLVGGGKTALVTVDKAGWKNRRERDDKSDDDLSRALGGHICPTRRLAVLFVRVQSSGARPLPAARAPATSPARLGAAYRAAETVGRR